MSISTQAVSRFSVKDWNILWMAIGKFQGAPECLRAARQEGIDFDLNAFLWTNTVDFAVNGVTASWRVHDARGPEDRSDPLNVICSHHDRSIGTRYLQVIRNGKFVKPTRLLIVSGHAVVEIKDLYAALSEEPLEESA